MAAALKLQGPRPLAESWPPLVKVVKDKEVVQAAEKCDVREGFRRLLPLALHIPFMMSLGQPIHRKPSLQFLALKREVILNSYCLSSKVLRDI